MKEFIIYSSEKVYYMTRVKAESAEQAKKMMDDGDISPCYTPIDSSGFRVDAVEEAPWLQGAE